MKIAIIGGGAAGLMVAATLLEKEINAEIYLFESNNILGKKVSISGGGRCNVTTGITDMHILLSKYTRGAKFLIPAFYTFSPDKVISWFESHGVPLKTEEDLRVFPKSNIGSDVIKVFEKIFKAKAFIHLNESVKKITPLPGEGFYLETKNKSYNFNIVVITSGGNAYGHTGSKGDGYNFAKFCNHTITKLGPSLSSFKVKEEWCTALTGISLPNAKLEYIHRDKSKIFVKGPFLFTHFGISGPVTFALSSHLAFEEISNENPKEISFFPIANSNFDFWNKELLDAFSQSPKKQVKHMLSKHLPERLAYEVLTLCKVNPNKRSSEVSKEERKNIVKALSGEIKLTLISRMKGDEFVTAGGVKLDEVNKNTMESKITPNLYFAGEVLDVDGLTGGFNLQSAWATGRLAGLSIAKKLNQITSC